MAASIKEITQKEVDRLQQQKLHESVSQLDAQINTLNSKFSDLEKFIKRWWPVAVAFVALISGIFILCFNIVTKYNELDKKTDAVQRDKATNKRIDSLIIHRK